MHAIQSAGSLETQLVGDVWSVHLPFVEDYICLDSEVKIVVMKRSREMVVNSFMAKTIDKKANHWQWHTGEGKKQYFRANLLKVFGYVGKQRSHSYFLNLYPLGFCYPQHPFETTVGGIFVFRSTRTLLAKLKRLDNTGICTKIIRNTWRPNTQTMYECSKQKTFLVKAVRMHKRTC